MNQQEANPLLLPPPHKMDDSEQKSLVISYLNLRGQTGFPVQKQLQVEQFLKCNKCDILHLQEVQIEDETFKECDFIESKYSVIVNNAENSYGTASLRTTYLLKIYFVMSMEE